MGSTSPANSADDRNLLFGVLALQADLLDPVRFAEACSGWAARKDVSLGELLVQRGWITPEDRADVERILERKLKRHAGDARAAVVEVTTDRVRQSVDAIADPELRRSLTGVTPPPAGHVLLSTSALLPETRERYTLSRLHATGGIGRVWLARDASVGRDVALKELRPERSTNPAVWARFLKEAQITGQLEHPGIVPIYEVGRRPDDQAPFYTMRFVRGRTLGEATSAFHVRRARGAVGPLELRELLHAFVGVCNAVAYAHSRGVLHRDLKPHNVVLGDFGEVIVLDWGLARLIDQPDDSAAAGLDVAPDDAAAATVQGQVLGTPAYMAPEQAEGRLDRLGPATDVYGLGAILFEILTGGAPFSSGDTTALLRRVVHELPAPPRELVADTPPALNAVCLKALAKEPAERYASAKELASEVEHWLAGEPVSAYREPWNERAGRWLRRHRQLVTAAAAVLIAAVPLLLVIAVNRDQARRQAERAEEEIRKEKVIAEANEKTAREREAETQAVLDFVESKVFAAARPEGIQGGLGRQVTLGRAVEAALPYVEKNFKDRPLIEARLLMTLGTSFRYLGDSAKAAAQFEKARTIYTAQHGGDEPDALMAANKLANCYEDIGRRPDALKLREETLALRKAKLGADHPDTLNSMNNLASSYYSLGRPADAAKLCEEVLALRKAKLGPDHADTLDSMNNLAVVYRATGRNADALKLFEEVVEIRKAKLGPDHLDTLLSLGNVTFGYLDAGRVADAARLQEQVLKAYRTKLGSDHPSTLESLEDLAEIYSTLGRHDEALKLTEEALAGRKAKLGPLHLKTLRSMSNLAAAYDAVGRHEDALKLAEETLALQKTNLGADDPETLRSMNNVADDYATLGRFADALKLHQETLTRRKAKLGDGHPETVWSQYRTAFCLAKLDRSAEALPLVDDALARATKRPGDPHLVPGLVDVRLRHFQNAKDAGGCRATAELWEKLNRTDADSLYRAACIRAVTAAVLRTVGQANESSAEADRAMDWLSKAVAAGYKDVGHIKKDNDLDSLREREDFKKLVAGLEAAQKEKTSSLKRQYEELAREYEAAEKAYVQRVTSGNVRVITQEMLVDHEGYCKRMLALAEQHLEYPMSVDALVWVMQHASTPTDPSRIRALLILRRDYMTSDRLGDIFDSRIVSEDSEWKDFLRCLIARNPSRHVKGRACLVLAEAFVIPSYFDYKTGFPAICPKMNEEAESLLERAVNEFGEVEIPYFGTVGEKAAGILFECRYLIPGKPVPDLEGRDLDGKPIRLSDYRGKVVLLIFGENPDFQSLDLYQPERALSSRYQGRAFAIVGVSGDKKSTIRDLKRRGLVTWQLIWDVREGRQDGSEERGPLAVKWNLRAGPTVYLIDDCGVIRQKWIGTPNYARHDQLINDLITQAEGRGKAGGGPAAVR
jgi:tetratricopeptide (TPR) repeat protein/peroxiredoxin/tRNA A-37 threonylcarbamoyl transferase component Bud32